MTAPAIRTYSIIEAGEQLAPVVTAGWLKRHIREIPHLRMGPGRGRAGRIGFTEAHLVEILAMHEVRPVSVPEPASSIVTRRRRA